jgi:spore germination protein (amino acid permease)
MEKNSKLGHREILTLLITIISGKVFLTLPRNLILLGDSAGWLIIGLAGLFSLMLFQLLYALIRKYPEDNIFEIARLLSGKYLGTGLGILIFLFFLFDTSLLIRQFAESFILAILPRTPLSIITAIFIVLLMYATFLGIETLSRVAWFFGPYLLLGLVAIFVFAFPNNPQQLLPLLGSGPLPITKNAVLQISSFAEIILLGVLAPLIREKDKVYGVGFWGLLISGVIITGITANVIMMFNYASASNLAFPVLQLTRLISLGKFVQRADSLFVFLWFLTAGIQIGGLFYGVVVSFSETFRIKEYRPLVFPLAILAFTLSMWPQSMTETNHIAFFARSKYFALITFGIPLLLWFLSIFIKPKRGATYE